MHPTTRQKEILRAVRSRGLCTILELAEQFSVSDETIRRDVKPMVSSGLIEKVHGGIIVPDEEHEAPFQRRMVENQEAKKRIGQALSKIIHDGDSLIFDTGSTTAFAAHALREHSNLLVVTNSVETARALATRNGNRVYIAGGELRADDAAAFGPSAISFVEQFDVKYAVLSLGGIDPVRGLMVDHLAEAEFSRTVMAQAQKTIVVADKSKFNRARLVKIGPLEGIDLLITDAEPDEALSRCLREAEVKVIIAR
ncbi:DeoR/GlpR family DNA-binding transcription regulator [Kiloniella laminariae]|uniref:DeoR/GlpR family DNA-binding transcription regulator n=1 Tax=Kiloniella laminariae TaxID=454162 RepID=A0ABT4LLV6_9PROT|nr:DeoR/GlpR family DNA-binding transcription regulator [Kiloniella laminariae]MCZ4281925.1 DeoR/GlpR family DNA-binding transcription regulator [Kiloniella laminariae]